MTSRATPVLLYGATIRPASSIALDASYRPSVTLLLGRAGYDTSVVARILYPGEEVFRSDSHSGSGEITNAAARADAAVAVRMQASPVPRWTMSCMWSRVGAAETALSAPGRRTTAGVDTGALQWTTLWGFEAGVRVSSWNIAVGVRQAVLGAWSFDGRRVEPVRASGPVIGVAAPLGPMRVTLDASRLRAHDVASVPVTPRAVVALRTRDESRATLTIATR